MKSFLNKFKEYLIRYSETCYFIGMGFGFLSFTWLNFNSEILAFINSIEIFRYLLAFLFIGIRLFSFLFIDKKHAIITYVILFLSLIPAYYSNSFYMLQAMVLVFGAYQIDFKKIVKCVLYFSLLTYLVDLIGVLTGNIRIIFDFPQGRIRCLMGFIHPSYFSIHFLTCSFCIGYLFFKEKKGWDFVFYLLGAAILWLIPNTRTSAFILAAMPFVYLITTLLMNTHIKFFEYLYMAAPVLFFVLSVVLTLVVPDSMESTFAIRFQQARALFETNGVHFFKCTLMWLDNSYMFLMQHYGIYSLLVYLYFFVSISVKAIKEKNWLILSMNILMLVYGMMDNYGINPRYNITLFYLYAKMSDHE